MTQDHDSRTNTGRTDTSTRTDTGAPRNTESDSLRNQALDREQHYPNEPEERNAAQQRLNDTGTGCEPDGIDAGIASADKAARTGGSREGVRNTPPFGDWDETGPVRPDPEHRT